MPNRSIEAKKKKRLTQLRDAQRRRREKLKNDSRHFVQIILPESTLQCLRIVIADSGETMQQAIARLVLSSLEHPGTVSTPPLPARLSTPPIPATILQEIPSEEYNPAPIVPLPVPVPEKIIALVIPQSPEPEIIIVEKITPAPLPAVLSAPATNQLDLFA